MKKESEINQESSINLEEYYYSIALFYELLKVEAVQNTNSYRAIPVKSKTSKEFDFGQDFLKMNFLPI